MNTTTHTSKILLHGAGTRVRAAILPLILALNMALSAAVPADLFEKGIYAEETKGDLAQAIELYEQVVSQPGVGRDLAAQAQLRLGLCHLKRGDKTKAVSAFESLTGAFPDKEQLLGVVRKQMPLVLDEILQQIEQNYIKAVDRADLMESAIRAILGKLDGETDFLAGQNLKEFNIQVSQQVVGIGVRLKWDAPTKALIVEAPLPGSPALKSGVRAGDQIVEIDRRPVSGFPEGKEMSGAIELVRGKPLEAVVLGIRRDGAEALEEITVVRDTIRLPTTHGDHRLADGTPEYMLDDAGKIGYVRLSYVGKESFTELQRIMGELTARGMRALVFDLRDCPGGMLDQAVEISDLFLEEGTIVTIRRREKPGQVMSAKKEGTLASLPLVVLVNRVTASAAEIITAALQDNQRALVVGERTFGQGLVRSMISLEQGKSALKLPTAVYYRPNGKNMHRFPDAPETDDWGVSPDPNYEVIFTDDEMKQFHAARAERELEAPSGRPAVAFSDRQLNKALDYLRTRLAQR